MQTTASNQSVYNYVVTIAQKPPYPFFKAYRRNEITPNTDHKLLSLTP